MNAAKRFCFILILIFACHLIAKPQYEPNTRWPYIYENFTRGTIFFVGGKTDSAELNIHLWGNVLHYISKDGRIYQSGDYNIINVEIGDDKYMYSDHKLMMLVYSKGENVLLKYTNGDFDSLFSGTGAYGASLNTSAVKDLSSLELGGFDKPELGKMLQDKDMGKSIPLKDVYYFIINDMQIEANRKAVEKIIPSQQYASWKKFLKDNNIKWKDPECLCRVLDYISVFLISNG